MDKATTSEYLKKLGEKLRTIRVTRGLSLRQLSALCSLDHSDISKIERGEVNIRIGTFIELAKTLEVHPKEILDFD